MMDNNSLPPGPPAFGFLTKRMLRIGVAVAASAVLVTMLLLCIVWMQNKGRKTGGTAGTDAVGTADDKQRNELQEKHESRARMEEFRHVVKMVKKDVNEFKTEAEKFTKRFEELKATTKGTPLQEYVEYFRARWEKEVPRIEWAAAYLDELQEYVVVTEETLQTKHGAIRITQETRDSVDYIAEKAATCALIYHNHNILVDYMSRLISEGPTADARTVQAAIYKKEDELAKNRLRTMPLSQLESRKSFLALTEKELNRFQSSRKPPTPGSEEDLYQQQRRRERADAQSRGNLQPLMRDTLPNGPRDE